MRRLSDEAAAPEIVAMPLPRTAPLPRIATTVLLATVALLACAPAPAARADAGSLPLELALRARELAPGEPVRVEVRAPAPLADLAAEFLGTPVDLQPAGEDRRLWTGWAMVALDEPAGMHALEVAGRDATGRPAAGTLGFRVVEREFPEERLTVQSKYVAPPPETQERLAREREKLDRIYARRSPLADPAGRFVRPVDGVPTSTFGTRRFFNDQPRDPHSGLDLRAATGTPVQAAGRGEVVLAEDLYYSGNTVILDHGGGLFTLYAHLSRIDVAEGDVVEPGRTVGLSGATGRVTAPHLHWGAKIDRRPFQPLALLDPALWEGPAAAATP